MNKRFALVFLLLFIFSAPISSQVKNKTTKENVKKETKVFKKSVHKVNKRIEDIDRNKESKNRE